MIGICFYVQIVTGLAYIQFGKSKFIIENLFYKLSINPLSSFLKIPKMNL